MSPARIFYSEENLPLWQKVKANEIDNQTGYGFKVKAAEGRDLVAFSVPDEEHLGFGRIIIPLRVPPDDEALSPNRTFKQEAKVNRGFFRAAQTTSEVLYMFGVKRDNPVKGEFRFNSDVRPNGCWLLIVDRELKEDLPQWRNSHDGKFYPISAAGLMESFNQKFQIGTLEPL